MKVPTSAIETDVLKLREAIEKLTAIIQYVDTFSPDRLPTDEEMGFDVEAAWNPPWVPAPPSQNRKEQKMLTELEQRANDEARHAHRELVEVELRNMALDYLAAEGQAAEAYQAQLAAKAKIAKAVEALGILADCVDAGCFCSEMEMATAMDKASTTLAELKGTER